MHLQIQIKNTFQEQVYQKDNSWTSWQNGDQRIIGFRESLEGI